MRQVRKKSVDKATEQAISQAAAAGISLAFDRYEDQVPACGFGRMGLDCKACTQGPCRISPFDPSNGTACGRDREALVAASFLRLIADGVTAEASFAGAEAQIAPPLLAAISLANEGGAGPAPLLEKAIDVAEVGLQALSAAAPATETVQQVEAGAGALKPDRVNILLLGGVPSAMARKIAGQLAANPRVNVVGAAGGEAAGVAVAGNYNSQEALLVTTGVDGVVAGKACVSPGFLALAARQGVPVVDADAFDAAALIDGAESHFRLNNGRNLAAKFKPAKATVGFTAGTFGRVSPSEWKTLAGLGVKGVLLIGGCNNAATAQDAAILRHADEALRSDVLVVASGCAGAALARAGYVDPDRRESLAGKALSAFLVALSEAAGVAVPAVLAGGTCWEMSVALELVQTLRRQLRAPVAAALPELSRPAGWASALALAARGMPTFVGPILPLDGGLETVKMLNDLLGARGGALLGPDQVAGAEAFVQQAIVSRARG